MIMTTISDVLLNSFHLSIQTKDITFKDITFRKLFKFKLFIYWTGRMKKYMNIFNIYSK